jgi:8-oxo-dGTP pyrophosphatase MutT (NUDIX family)
MEPQKIRPVVSAILQKKDKDDLKIFIQTRWKPHIDSPYSGMLEIPAGGIDAYENVYDALKREVKEECGLDVVKIINDFQTNIDEPVLGDRAFAFNPFLCQQVLSTRNGLPWIGFVFLCEVEGEIKMQENEAKDPIWVSLDELEEILSTKPDKIFPLQLPVLKYYLKWAKKNTN